MCLGLVKAYKNVSQKYGYHFGVPIIRTIEFWGLYSGPPILGNYHIRMKPTHAKLLNFQRNVPLCIPSQGVEGGV